MAYRPRLGNSRRSNRNFRAYAVLLFAVGLLIAIAMAQHTTSVDAAAFASGNLVVYRVGDGSAALSSAAAVPVFIDEYTAAGTFVQTIAIPTTTVGANRRLTATGNSTSEGLLTRSADAQYLILTGYDAAVGTASPNGQTSASVNRVVGRVNPSGTIDTSTALTDAFSGGNVRSATSTNGTDLWVDGSVGGIRYATLSATTSTALSSATPLNNRQANIFAGQLYMSQQSGAFRLSTVGTGTPTTAGQTITNLPGYPTGTTSPYGFFFADLDAGVAGVDTVYVADDNTAGGTGGIQKYSLVSGNWVARNTIASTAGLRGLTGVVSGSTVTLYATSPSNIFTLTDTSGYNTNITGTLTSIVTAGTNTAFRGVALSPVPFDNAPSVSNTSPLDTATNVPLNSNVSVTFSEAVGAPAGAFTISCATSGGHGFTLSTADNITFTLDPVSDFVNNELCTVTVDDAQVTDADAIDPPNNMAADYIFSFTTVPATPTNPSGVGAANPSSVPQGTSSTLTMTVTPGQNPTSTGLAVSCDLSSIGGSATQSFSDDGTTNGDTNAGDNIFTFNATVAFATTPGAKTLPCNISDGQARAGSADISLTVTLGSGTCGNTFTPTYTIQGSGTASPIVGSTVNTEGVVVGDFQGSTKLSGFYIQDPTGDANTATSDGIFVFDGASPAVAVNVGDRVRVSGTVAETFNNTQITPTLIQICSTGNTLPAATVVDLPETVNDDLEHVENMLVTFPETLTVTGNFTWGRFGELVLSSDARMYQQNSFDRPGTAGALARADLNARAYVFLDDGLSIQNPNPIPYKSPDNTRRTGDTVTGLTGVLTFDFSQYRVQPTVAPVFAQANPRPAAPASVGGTLKVASSNVLNYFNGNGAGGGFPTSRGASTLAEFNRQRDKIIAALTTLNADIIGVSEVENDGGGSTSALQDLVNGMNAATAPGTYVGLHSPNPGTDLIQNAIIYKPASVTPVGAQVNDINSAWDQARAPLAQIFTQNSNGEKFTFIVNHFTSKGCSASDTGIDADTPDGQGCDNGQRQIQANRLLVFIQDRKVAANDPDVLSMGDYNAYGEEDPLFILEDDSSDTLLDGTGGLVSETKRFIAQADRYSFQFGNQFGELDHAFATKTMNSQVVGTTIWHINSDEPVAIDYNTEFKTEDLYTPTPYRASDHDPLLVGLNLSPAQPAGSVIISEFRFRGPDLGPPVAPSDAKGGWITQRVSPSIMASTADTNEFIEFYNNTNSDIIVSAADGSAGWALVAADGTVRFTIPNGTTIPARGHYLAVNSGYSLSNYGGPGAAAGNITYTQNIPDGSGIALFRTANAASFTLSERLDAVGYASVNSLYREGAGFQTGAPGAEIGGNIEYSFVRTMTRATGGLPKDTGDNSADFMSVDTSAAATSIGQNLGAPGPENLSSPINRNVQFGASLLDPTQSSASPPNRVRNLTAVPNGDFGTMLVRRTFTNNTGMPITRLRFRIVEVTTLTSPPVSGQADLRALDSTLAPTGELIVTAGGSVTVLPTTLEQPPAQAIGGGWNSSLSVPYVTPGAPIIAGSVPLAVPLNAGQSISVEFRLGVQTPGRFFFYVNIEAGTGGCAVPLIFEPCAITKPMQVK